MCSDPWTECWINAGYEYGPHVHTMSQATLRRIQASSTTARNRLSYRERMVLGRDLKPEDMQYFAEVARRISGILPVTASSGSSGTD